MASIALRLKPKPCSLRLFSSSSSATPPPPSSNDAEDPSASFPSYLSDIKARLREPPSPTPRRIPINPPKPDIFSPQGSDKVASLDEIRKNLAEFRRRSAPPSSPNSSRPTSLLDAYKIRPDKPGGEGGEDGRSDRISLSAIRESLQQLKATAPQQVPGAPGRSRPSAGSISLRSLKDSLKITPGRLDALPKSIFGKELEKHEDGGTEPKVRNKEFLKQYSHEELGEKLRMLRPKAENGGEQRAPFSLHELNERLARLRELEEKETASRMGGVHFMDLKESLMKLRDSDAKKKTSMHRLSIIGHIAGQTSPNYMRGPPKEELVEKYFHPDLMSSAEKMKLELKRVRDEFKMSESDCGSARVQVAQLTTKIKHLSSVLHKKDKHSQKGLQAMVQTRKKLLKYLRRTDWDSYSFVLSKLGLRDAPDYRT